MVRIDKEPRFVWLAARMRNAQAFAARGAAIPALWYLATAVVCWSFGYTVMLGSDLWWHLAGGRWMVEHGTVFVRDPFSFTASNAWWLNDAWLADVFLHLWSVWFGRPSLTYWKWLCIVATWLLLFRHLARASGVPLAAFLATVVGLAVAAPFLDVRPQLFSFLGFVLLIELTLGRERPSGWLLLLFLLWANLHAGFLIGVLTLPLLMLPAWVGSPEERRRLLLLTVACWAVCLVNPNGMEAFSRPFRYAFDPNSPFRELGEWLPPFRPGGIRSWLYPYAIVGFALASACLGYRWYRGGTRARDWVAVALTLLTLVMSLRSRRFVPFFAIAQTLPLTYAAGQLLVPANGRRSAWLWPSVALCVGLTWLWPFPKHSGAFHFLTADYEFPIDTCAFIEANQLAGHVFNYYNWGGFVHLCTNGRLKVFIDGRSETVYADETFLRYIDVLQQKPGWQQVVDRSDADYVLWPLRHPGNVRALVESGRWQPLYTDSVATLLARTGLHGDRAWQMPHESPHRLLTLGFVALQSRRLNEAVDHFEAALRRDPNLLPACRQLAVAHALAGNVDATERALERCAAIFPMPGGSAWRERLRTTAQAARGG